MPRDEGDPVRAAPVFYYYNPLYHAAGYIYALPLLLAFVGLKENRKLAALWILLPILLVWGAWRGVAAIMDFSEESVDILATYVLALVTAFSLVWLLGERIGRRHRFITFLWAAVILLAGSALMLIDVETTQYRIQLGVFGAVSALILLAGFTITGFFCRKRFGPVRFTALMIPALLIGTILIMGTYLLVAIVWNDLGPQTLFLVFIPMIYAGIYWLLTLPFLVLFFVNNFWRRRFAAVMGIGGKAAVPEVIPPQEPMV